MRTANLLATLGVATALLTACAAPPPFHFYTLTAVATPSATASALVVALGPVTVPQMIDRPEIVVTTGPNEVNLDDFNRWASPLQDNLSHALATDLALQLGTSRVLLSALPAAAPPDYRVAVDVRTVESALGDAASLDAVWTVRRTRDDRSQTGHTAVRVPVSSPGYPGIAGAHSRAVATLGKDIADAIAALQTDAR